MATPSPSTNHITQLPPEILGEIFTHCTSSNPDAPILLSSVCRAFQHATHLSPHLWRRLRLSISEAPDTDRGAALKAETWFARAGVCVMEVEVEIPKAFPILDETDVLVRARGTQTPKLSLVLGSRRDRIGGLVLRAYTERQAHSFLDSIYVNTPSLNGNTHALRRLELFVASDRLPIEEQQIPGFLPLLSDLTHLTLTSPGVPHLSPGANLGNLRCLVILRPIRSLPLPLESIVDVLLASSGLVRFELETRLDLPLDTPLNSPISSSSSTSSSSASSSPLITMPELTHLSLRTNNNPILLGRLVVPALHNLHLNALDGKRPGRAEKTADALRKMLTRMDTILPSPPSSFPPTQNKGIETFELAGISIYRPPHSLHRVSTGTNHNTNTAWEWCFRNMPHLRSITARNMDAEHLLELLALPISPIPSTTLPNQAAPLTPICPHLTEINVPTSPTSPSMRTFRTARPRVRVSSTSLVSSPTTGSPPDALPVYGWDSEEALKPRKSAKALLDPPSITPDPVSAPIQDRMVGKDNGKGKGKAREVIQEVGVKDPSGSSHGPTIPNPDSPRPPPPLPRGVGGFGFGSSFSLNRMRGGQGLRVPPLPPGNGNGRVPVKKDGINW